jgi:hypothetical protein
MRHYLRTSAILLMGALAVACNHYKRNDAHPEIPGSSIEKGEALAAQYCQSCHVLPDPSLLDVKSWEKGVLPHMGPLLGIASFNGQTYPSNRNDRFLDHGYYPSAPMLKPEDWQHIIDYYIATSPDSLPGQQRPEEIREGLSLFKAIVPVTAPGPPATSCLIQVDTSRMPHTLLVGDVITQKILRWDARLDIIDSVRSGGPVVGLDLGSGIGSGVGLNSGKGKIVACNIGLLNPSNAKLGKGQTISLDAGGKMRADSSALFDNLARPVQITAADLNGDGRMDYLVCEFGYMTGALSWMENRGDSGFIRHVIRAVPGAIKAYINDYNHDGLPDLWVLFAQADEGIFLFTNKGKGEFSAEEVLRFPPAWGSSYFELADFNKDGYPDIVYTCGDNADFSTVLKPYHGVYIFMNDGKNHFTQRYFFPINGCYKAMARDFDGDGDLDIATIAFFADYKQQPDEGFVYLENKGNFNFTPWSLPEGRMGRWLTMDVGDLDGDGRTDIILGNFSVAPGFVKPGIDWKKGPPFLFLKNIGK